MFRRNIETKIGTALKDTPVVFLTGARQTGKSTLVKKVGSQINNFNYLTFDDATVLSSASSDPSGFVKNLSGTTVIDEVQKVPDLLSAIKLAVDNDRRPGSFILTGSANIMLLPKVSESLAGRMEIITMHPLSQGELENSEERFVDMVFSDTQSPFSKSLLTGLSIVERIFRGGFPEAFLRMDDDRRRAWYGSYVSAIMQRDIRDMANIEGLTELPRLLALVVARTGSIVNMSDLSRGLGLPHSTLKRYLSFLEMAFLLKRIPAWSANMVKRLVKAPKLYLCDTGLAAYLAGASTSRFSLEPLLRGQLFENLVAMELTKQISWASSHSISLYHYRTSDGREIDFILEDPAGRVVAVEVKSSASVGPEDFSIIRQFAAMLGDRFIRGIVLYSGDHVLSFGERMLALPVWQLWQSDPTGSLDH